MFVLFNLIFGLVAVMLDIMLGSTLHGNWESPCLPTGRKGGLHWEVQGHKPMINGQGQSDGEIVCAGQRMDQEG